MHIKDVSNSPIWHLSWRYKEPTPKPRHSTQHWRNSMGIVRSRGDDKDQHGHPCLVEGDTEHSCLKKHPETVLIIGDGLQSIVGTFKFDDLYQIGYNRMVSDRRFKRQQLLGRETKYMFRSPLPYTTLRACKGWMHTGKELGA